MPTGTPVNQAPATSADAGTHVRTATMPLGTGAREDGQMGSSPSLVAHAGASECEQAVGIALTHAAWRDGRSAVCGISYMANPRTTFLHADVTCPECRERIAARVARDSGISVDDVKRAKWGGDR